MQARKASTSSMSDTSKLQQLLQQIQQESGGDFPEELNDQGNLQRLLEQIQQDPGSKQSHVPDGGEEVTPKAGFVIKTTDESNRKVFINICGSDKVPMAGGWADGKIPDEAKAFLESTASSSDAQPSEALQLPLSLGETKPEVDKQGEPCTVYDVVFNEDAIKQAKAFRQLKVFIINLSMGWIQKQKNTTLNPKYKLPKMPYKGTNITKQIMRVRKKPLVTDMRDVVEDPEFPLLTKRRPITVPERPKGSLRDRKDLAETAASSSQAADKLKASSLQATPSSHALETTASNSEGGTEMTSSVSFSGRPVEHILVNVDLSRNATAAQLEATTAEVAGDHVHTQAPGHQALDIQLPFAVSVQGATASWEKENKRLLLSLPYLSCRDLIEQISQSKQRQVPLSDLAYDSYLELEP